MPRYEFVEGTSSKFWEITLEGSSFTTRYGKIGTEGQSTTKEFPDEAKARKEYDKLVAEKTKKGYVLVEGGDAAPAPAAAPKAAAPKAAEPKGKGKKAEAAPAPAPAPAPAAAAAPSDAQRYELVEGTSSKFWEITRSGSALTVRYGKIGSAGQTTLKELKSEAEAEKEHRKLVAEKTKKGYVLVSGGAGGGGGEGPPAPGGSGRAPVVHAKAGTAFRMADLEQLDGDVFSEEEDDGEGRGPTFMGLKRVDYSAEEGLKDPARRAWRIRDEDFSEEPTDWLKTFQHFTGQPGADKVKAFVVGNWGGLTTSGGSGTPAAAAVRDAICAAKGQLSSLAALFVNDVLAEECEISWQNFTDPTPILAAYPNLQHLRVRGDTGTFGPIRHERLRSLQLEGTNLRNAVVQGLAEADLPALEHLEVWLGPDEYAEEKQMADLLPLLSGKLFPALRYLGLRCSSQADEVARTVAEAPLLARLETLDLSLGTLGDEGAEALLASPAVARLQKLDLRSHYISEPVLKRLKALKPVKVVESPSEREPEEYGGEVHRYTAVAE